MVRVGEAFSHLSSHKNQTERDSRKNTQKEKREGERIKKGKVRRAKPSYRKGEGKGGGIRREGVWCFAVNGE